MLAFKSLEDCSPHPKHARQPIAPWELVQAVLELRHPKWGKNKLSELLKKQGYWVCASIEITDLGEDLIEWEHIYNTVRPYQTLGYLTPLTFIEQQRGEPVHRFYKRASVSYNSRRTYYYRGMRWQSSLF